MIVFKAYCEACDMNARLEFDADLLAKDAFEIFCYVCEEPVVFTKEAPKQDAEVRALA